ncbi:MAG: permease [Pseudomonadota bacterium]
MSLAVATPDNLNPRGPSLHWFARHELTLAWRDWAALMSGGRKLKDTALAASLVILALLLHGLGYILLQPVLTGESLQTLQIFFMLSAFLVLAFTMALSQALESVTRAFYARDDLDLILSSPASAARLFAVRITMMALTTFALAALLIAPFINAAAYIDGPAWLAGYAVLLALSAVATAAAVMITMGLLRWVGPRRTRLIAQITAAVVGASFVIGIQVVAIIGFGSMSRFSVLTSADALAALPDTGSWLWLPAKAVMGEAVALLCLSSVCLITFLVSTAYGAKQFGDTVVMALASGEATNLTAKRRAPRRLTSIQAVLIAKEWMLLARDPWLLSQTLMQILYLLPPGLMLYVNFAGKVDVVALVAPVIVMAIGQLAGGLAWLTISGEDAPDLMQSAPVSARQLLLAKVNAVSLIITAIAAPLLLVLMFLSPWGGLMTAFGLLGAAACAVTIQVWFRAQATRRNFRRRHVASKASTFCEAFASILCAAATGLAVIGSPFALATLLLLLLVMGVAWLLSPATP